jgi:type II secretory pathway component GspD/PulD (secretin)
MTYSAKITLNYSSTSDLYNDNVLPEEKITMEVPAENINIHQAFKFYSNFLRAIGHLDISIMRGACALAFNDLQSEEDMKKVAQEYDLILIEDNDVTEVESLRAEILNLKAQLSRALNPDNPQYTDEEMDAMSYEVL